jgi:peptidyl-prolyl cis-trans isomerase D
MLEIIHKHMKWIMWAIVVLITVTFLFFGIYPSDVGTRSIAKVGGDSITVDEYSRVYRNLYERFKEMLGDQMNEDMVKSLKLQAIQELVIGRLLVQEAARIGLKISDKELQTAIMNMPSFSRDGRFDKKLYDRILDQINKRPAAFETDQREFLLRQKLEQLVKDGVTVTDAELAAAYQQKNPKANSAEFENDRETFTQALLAEKRRNALIAYVRGIQNRTTVEIDEKAIAL